MTDALEDVDPAPGPADIWAGDSGPPGQAYLPPPPGHRPSGSAPFFQPGQHIRWIYRRAHGTGATRPVRVVRDDAAGLVVWLAPGTPVTASALPDGRPIRSVPTHQVFRQGRSLRSAVWEGSGLLKLAPSGAPWSLWRFTDPAGPPTWYVNLEDPHCRAAEQVLTQDHVLDLVVEPGGRVLTKDADELAAAVDAGRFSAADAARINADAGEAKALAVSGAAPFDGSWDDWAADPDWPLPQLPADLAALPPVLREPAPDGHLARLRAGLSGAAPGTPQLRARRPPAGQ